MAIGTYLPNLEVTYSRSQKKSPAAPQKLGKTMNRRHYGRRPPLRPQFIKRHHSAEAIPLGDNRCVFLSLSFI